MKRPYYIDDLHLRDSKFEKELNDLGDRELSDVLHYVNNLIIKRRYMAWNKIDGTPGFTRFRRA